MLGLDSIIRYFFAAILLLVVWKACGGNATTLANTAVRFVDGASDVLLQVGRALWSLVV